MCGFRGGFRVGFFGRAEVRLLGGSSQPGADLRPALAPGGVQQALHPEDAAILNHSGGKKNGGGNAVLLEQRVGGGEVILPAVVESQEAERFGGWRKIATEKCVEG
jgi:hypothetical protein